MLWGTAGGQSTPLHTALIRRELDRITTMQENEKQFLQGLPFIYTDTIFKHKYFFPQATLQCLFNHCRHESFDEFLTFVLHRPYLEAVLVVNGDEVLSKWK